MWAVCGVVAAGSVLEDSLEQASILQSTRSIDLQKSIGQDVATAATTPMGVASVSNLDLVELTKDEKEQFLDEHNYYRCMHGAPALKWDDVMADSAATWGESCCGEELEHSNSYQETPKSGENLAGGQGTIREAVRAWYREVSDCNFPGCEPVENGPMVGHFTAMVWKSTALLGCVRNAASYKQGLPLYVCRYAKEPPNLGHTKEYRANVFGASVSSKDCGRDLGGGSVLPTVNSLAEFNGLDCVATGSLNGSLSSTQETPDTYGWSCLPCRDSSQCAGSDLPRGEGGSWCCPRMKTCIQKSFQKCSLHAGCDPAANGPINANCTPRGQETTLTWETWGKPTCSAKTTATTTEVKTPVATRCFRRRGASGIGGNCGRRRNSPGNSLPVIANGCYRRRTGKCD